jgi:hypothetical protein
VLAGGVEALGDTLWDVVDGGLGNDHGWYDGTLDKVRNVERCGGGGGRATTRPASR